MKKVILVLIGIMLFISLVFVSVGQKDEKFSNIRPNAVIVQSKDNPLKKYINIARPKFENRVKITQEIKVPVLLYHEINDDPANVYETLTNDFKDQMQYLKDNKFIPISISKFDKLMDEKINLKDKKYVLINFDDGCLSAYQNAIPILKSFNFEATFFIIPSILNTDGYMTSAQVKQLSKDYDIENHSYDHTWIADLSYADQVDNFNKANEILKNITGKKPLYIAYPYGYCDANIVIAAKEVGLKLGFVCNDGMSDSLSNPMIMNRQIIWRWISLNEFGTLLN